MASYLRDIMTRNPVSIPAEALLVEASRAMRDKDIGAVVVKGDDGNVCGIITDRDIVVRGVAAGADPTRATVGDVCTRKPIALSSGETIDEAVKVMRKEGVRRVLVEENGAPVGIVSLGDLAIAKDRKSALGEISARSPNR